MIQSKLNHSRKKTANFAGTERGHRRNQTPYSLFANAIACNLIRRAMQEAV
jgi:hypothetical protein